jgi:pilus assembly protein FimV
MPERARTLLAGIDLDLSPAKKLSPEVAADTSVISVAAIATEPNPLADALRVKLNLARAYITIEDFTAAKKSLQEIIQIGESIDPAITVEAKNMLLELSQRYN